MGVLTTAASTGSQAGDLASALASITASEKMSVAASAAEGQASFAMNMQEAKTKFEENAGKMVSDAASMGGQ